MANNAVAHALIPRELRERLEELARANERSVAGQIRKALAEHVRQEQAANPRGALEPKEAQQ